MFSINNLDIQYGDKHLFRNISVRINNNERIGLVGVNGAGKSTLLKIIAGVTKTDSGVTSRARFTSVAYLPQEATAMAGGKTIYQEAESAFDKTLAQEQELTEINHRLSTINPTDSEFAALLSRQGEIQQHLEQADIFRLKSQIERVLLGLGFREADFDMDTSSLSGGWIMRLMLAKLLLAKPSLLLLDEPTNHLDLESLTWLESFLLNHRGALVIISHDRTFLDRVTSITWELSLGRLTVFKGNYSKYCTDKEVRLQVEQAAYDNQQAQIKQTMRFVQRFRAKSTKAKQVQSRLKQLAKMEKVDLAETEHTVSFRFPPAADCGRVVLEIDRLGKSFDDKQVFADLCVTLLRGDKMAVVGVNGAGKSTLMKILAGLETADHGKFRLGHNAKISYFGQHQAQELEPSLTLLQTITSVAPDMTLSHLRSLLGAFLFRGDDVDKKVAVLSGGEKSRLALAKMIVQPANLLILDEPTNHLDMSSQEVLQEAMRQYDGAIIVVSHNRYFVNRFISKVLEIKDGQGSLFEGNIDDYLAKTAETEPLGVEKEYPIAADRESSENSLKARGKEARQAQAKIRKEKGKHLTPLKKLADKAEKDIEQLEKQKKELEKKLADPGLYRDEQLFSECSREYKAVCRRLDRQYLQWEELQGKIESVEAEYQ